MSAGEELFVDHLPLAGGTDGTSNTDDDVDPDVLAGACCAKTRWPTPLLRIVYTTPCG